MKKFFFLLLSALSVIAVSAASRPDAGAAELLKKFAEKGKNFRPVTGRSVFFSRGQMKYGLQRSDYLHRWVDRPLFQNSRYKDSDRRDFIHPEGWKLMHRMTGLYNMDGFAFFPQTKQRMALFDLAATPGYKVILLPELIRNKPLAEVIPVVEAALKSPQVYRFNGKIIFTTYSGDTRPDYWVKLKKELTARYGDHFLILPMHKLPRQYTNARIPLTAKDINAMAEIIRQWLRQADGYYYNNPPLNELRYYDETFDREIMLPLLTGILAEDEFKGKLLAWGTKVGHENFYIKGSFTYNCGGTSMLRGSVGSAVAARADIINMVEWDEQNENTSFRPTLYNSMSTQRIIRALSGMANGKLLPVQPGDDPAVPNLILSYRKILAAGETIDFEVVNVPEAGTPDKNLNFTLVLKNISGSTVQEYHGTLPANRMAEKRFQLPVADVLDHHVLIPELTVDGRKFASGFTPIELRANWNGDHKWVKQPLRDLADCRTELKIDGITPDGMLKITGKVESVTPLHSIDLTDGGNHIYQHGTDLRRIETADRAAFTMIVRSDGKRNIRYSGSIRVKNAPSVYCYNRHAAENICRLTANGWDFLNAGAISKFNAVLSGFTVNKSDLAQAVLEIDLKLHTGKKIQTFKQYIPLADVAKKQLFAISGELGSTIVIRRSSIQCRLPEPLDTRSAEFTFYAPPALAQSVFFLEIVDRDRKTFRSLPVTVYRPSGKKAEFSAFDVFRDRPVKVNCDAAMLMTQDLEISPVHGTAVHNSGGNDVAGMLGNFAALANDLRLMEDYSRTNFASNWQYAHNFPNGKNFPEVVKSGANTFAWKFRGSQNVTLPIAVIYPYSGFELTMDLVPEQLSGIRTLAVNNHAGFTLTLKNGVPEAKIFLANYMLGRRARRPEIKATAGKLQPGKKYRLTVRFDQKHLQVSINGKPGKAVPAAGYQLYPSSLSIGLNNTGNGFYGEIHRFSIKPL